MILALLIACPNGAGAKNYLLFFLLLIIKKKNSQQLSLTLCPP